jgi:histidine kinase
VLLVTTSDITQQIETEQQLIQASKMTTLGEMATGVAHELNQPLSVMKTASSFMLKKFAADQIVRPEIFREMLRKIDANVDRAANIIQHMRQFARKSEVDLEPVDINHTLQMALEIFSEQLKVRGIQVQKRTEKGLPRILGNPSRLEQVFINLLLNARDAIEEKWGDKPADPADRIITLSTCKEGDGIVAMVCDTGTGIPPSVMDKIFEPFFTTKTVGKGTGLGLSISYGIMQQHGGTIQAAVRDTGGTCFTLKFPVPKEG